MKPEDAHTIHELASSIGARGLARLLSKQFGVSEATIRTRIKAGVTGAKLYEPPKPRNAPTLNRRPQKLKHPWKAPMETKASRAAAKEAARG